MRGERQRILRPAAAALAAWLLAALPSAADYAAGVAAYAAGDYAAAVAEWRPLADAGDADAQYGMGLIYESGRGVGRDYGEAAGWYRLAAEQGHAGAQFNLGHLYRLGAGVPRDMISATLWWRAAAEEGLSQAQLALGIAYQRGDGVPVDPVQAVAWFRRAAESGNPAADYALGLAYETGTGVGRDPEEARRHYEVAAAAGIEPALERLTALSFAATAEDPPAPPPEAAVQDQAVTILESDGSGAETTVAERLADATEEVGATATGEGPRYIQIAAYVDEGRARRAWGELVAAQADLLGGLPHRVLAVDLGGETGRVYRLQAGPLPEADEAETICALLKARNTDCFLVKP